MKNKIIEFIGSILRLIRGEVSTSLLVKRGLKVGKNFSRQGGVRIDPSYCFLIEIGENVILAPNVTILAHVASLKNVLGVTQLGRVVKGNNVFVGAGTIIHNNVKIGENVIIGAGSNVTKDIPENSVSVGNPAKVISTISDFKNKKNKKIKTSVTFDRSFGAVKINIASKAIMNEKLMNDCGFFECANFKEMEASRRYEK
jgi:maltose O-acetyltransferase